MSGVMDHDTSETASMIPLNSHLPATGSSSSGSKVNASTDGHPSQIKIPNGDSGSDATRDLLMVGNKYRSPNLKMQLPPPAVFSNAPTNPSLLSSSSTAFPASVGMTESPISQYSPSLNTQPVGPTIDADTEMQSVSQPAPTPATNNVLGAVGHFFSGLFGHN